MIFENIIPNILIYTIIVFSVIAFIFGIIIFVSWIKHSWINRENSLNYTGADLTKHIFRNNNINAEVKSSFWYAKYWNHNSRRNTYKLRPWTHSRKSLWTMMEASQQAYATVIKNNNKRKFFIVFRLPFIINIISLLVSVALVFYATKNLNSFSDIWKAGISVWSFIIFSVVILFLSASYSVTYRSYTLKKNVVPMIKSIGFLPHEIETIQKIFNLVFIYSFLIAIIDTLWLILDVIRIYNDGEIKMRN